MVSLSHVSKSYNLGRSEVFALRDVSLQVLAGNFISVTGPSGSGKSTLMNLMGCLDFPSSGEVYLNGRLVNSLSDGELAPIRGEEIGFVFQSFNLIPRINALENVILPMSFTSKVPGSERKLRGQSILRKVGLEGRMQHRPSEMSGGERQRVAIARALANDPSLILADEPTGNLDSGTGRGIMELLKSLNEEGKTIVVVTHNQMVSSFARRVIQLKDGEIVNGGW